MRTCCVTHIKPPLSVQAAASPDSTTAAPAISDDIAVALADKSKAGKGKGRKLAQTSAQPQSEPASVTPDVDIDGAPEDVQAAAEPSQLVQDGTPLLRVHSGPPTVPAGSAAAEAARASSAEHGQQGGNAAGQGGSGHRSGYRAQQAGPRSEGFVTIRSKYGGLHRHTL